MDYKKLSTDDKIAYVLKLIDEGLTPKEVSDKMGYSDLRNLNRFMNNNGFSKQGNYYILMEDTCPTNDIQSDTTTVEVTPKYTEDTCPTNSIQNQQKLIDIIDNHSKIMDIIKWFDTKEDTCPTEVIEVVTGLQIDYKKSNSIKTTVRVDDDVWTTFSNICKDKYSQFSKVDILSQILHEFNKVNE